MKVYRIDFEWGEYDTLTELELKLEYTEEEIKELKNSEKHFLFETPYTVKQLNKARRLHNSEDYCLNFQDKYGIYPEVYDILKMLY